MSSPLARISWALVAFACVRFCDAQDGIIENQEQLQAKGLELLLDYVERCSKTRESCAVAIQRSGVYVNEGRASDLPQLRLYYIDKRRQIDYSAIGRVSASSSAQYNWDERLQAKGRLQLRSGMRHPILGRGATKKTPLDLRPARILEVDEGKLGPDIERMQDPFSLPFCCVSQLFNNIATLNELVDSHISNFNLHRVTREKNGDILAYWSMVRRDIPGEVAELRFSKNCDYMLTSIVRKIGSRDGTTADKILEEGFMFSQSMTEWGKDNQGEWVPKKLQINNFGNSPSDGPMSEVIFAFVWKNGEKLDISLDGLDWMAAFFDVVINRNYELLLPGK